MCIRDRRKDVENFTPNFLDRVPFDLYLAIDIVLFLLSIILFDNVLFFDVAISLPLCVLIVAVMGLLVLAFLMTCSTRFKIGKWWRNSIIYMWLAKPIAKFLSWLGRQLKEIFNNINLLWKGILLYCAFILLSIIFFFNSISGAGLASLLLVVLGIASFPVSYTHLSLSGTIR